MLTAPPASRRPYERRSIKAQARTGVLLKHLSPLGAQFLLLRGLCSQREAGHSVSGVPNRCLAMGTMKRYRERTVHRAAPQPPHRGTRNSADH